jgi:hypothetical protein
MNEKQLEEALYDWPLDEVPAGFSDGVMQRIEARPEAPSVRPVEKPKFRLTWLDYALGLFLSLLPALGLLTLPSLPRKFFLYTQYQLLAVQSPAYEPVLLALVGAAVMLLLLVCLLGIRTILPQRMRLF